MSRSCGGAAVGGLKDFCKNTYGICRSLAGRIAGWIGRLFGGLLDGSASLEGERGRVARTAAAAGAPVWSPTAARPSFRPRRVPTPSASGVGDRRVASKSTSPVSFTLTELNSCVRPAIREARYPW